MKMEERERRKGYEMGEEKDKKRAVQKGKRGLQTNKKRAAN